MKGGDPGHVVGRYALFDEIAAGGMGTVHLGRVEGAAGFSRVVAVKRLHPHLAHEPQFVKMLADEARVAARVHHPNVVGTLDVIMEAEEILLVLEYVHGESLARLVEAGVSSGRQIPALVATAIVVNALHGLHAAHEACDELGEPLGIIHRDVSPQNVIVGADGIARVLDFGVARATGRLQSTAAGTLKGKAGYMAPEQIRGGAFDRRVDVYGSAVVLWEALTSGRLVTGENHFQMLAQMLEGAFSAPSMVNPRIDPRFDPIVMKGLARDPADRYATAQEMALAIEKGLGVASPVEVAAWVKEVASQTLAARAARVRALGSASMIAAPEKPSPAPATDQAPTRVVANPLGTVPISFAPRPPSGPPGSNTDATIALSLTPEGPYPSAPPAAPSAPPAQFEPASTGDRDPSRAVATVRRERASRKTWPRRIGRMLVVLCVLGIPIGFVGLSRDPRAKSIRAAAWRITHEVTARPSERAPEVASPASALGAPLAASAALPPASISAASAVGSAASSPAPTAAPSTKAESSASGAKPPRPVRRTAPRPSSGKGQPPGCDPPTFLDADGLKQVKPECQ